jgi:hypothetical protein
MDEAKESGAAQQVPKGQEIFDNPWLWLALGLGVPTVFYILWGLADLLLL